jgi:cobalamin-dependent methionine synthase I
MDDTNFDSLTWKQLEPVQAIARTLMEQFEIVGKMTMDERIVAENVCQAAAEKLVHEAAILSLHFRKKKPMHEQDGKLVVAYGLSPAIQKHIFDILHASFNQFLEDAVRHLGVPSPFQKRP